MKERLFFRSFFIFVKNEHLLICGFVNDNTISVCDQIRDLIYEC